MAVCDKCGFEGEFVTEEYGRDKIIICPDCHSFKASECLHENTVLKKYEVNGSFRVQNMCLSCFTLHGQFIKQAELNMSEIRFIDKAKYDKWLNEQAEKYQKRYSALVQEGQERDKKVWFDKHNEYLNSMEWKEKRDEVLNRDDHLCQACLKRKATQVHHINYKHWGNEPLFDLISVCDSCHEAITEMDRNNLIA